MEREKQALSSSSSSSHRMYTHLATLLTLIPILLFKMHTPKQASKQAAKQSFTIITILGLTPFLIPSPLPLSLFLSFVFILFMCVYMHLYSKIFRYKIRLTICLHSYLKKKKKREEQQQQPLAIENTNTLDKFNINQLSSTQYYFSFNQSEYMNVQSCDVQSIHILLRFFCCCCCCIYFS